jgi:hypothetical protein
MAFALEKLKKLKDRSEEGVWVELLDIETGEPSGGFVLLIGAESAEFIKLKHRMENVQAKRRGRQTSEMEEADGLDLLAACTKDWKGIENAGKPVPFSREAARELYKAYPSLRAQVDRAIMDRAAFLRD